MPRRARAVRVFAVGLLATLVFLCGEARAQSLLPRVANLAWPWSIALLPDGRFLITEREGRLLLVSENGQRRILEGTPPTLFAGQGGYFDVTVDNRFASNGYIYLSYAEGKEQENGLAVFRARLEKDRLVEGRQILRIAQDKSTPQHYGGRMLMFEDHLILTSGDGFEHREDAQDWDSELGKVLRIDRDGQPAGTPGLRGEPLRVWTRGHRNPQGLALDASRGVVYLHEHGPRGGDEINVLKEGNNYGWPIATHGINYSGAFVSPFRSIPGGTDPIWVWTPSIAPSGMAFYSGSRFPGWRDSLLVGALVDREVRRLKVVDDVIVSEETLFSELGARIRDIRVYGERIFVLTDGANGTLYEVVR